MEYGTILCGIAVILVCILWMKWLQNYWTRKGVYQIKPELFFGNMKDIFLRKKAVAQSFLEIYMKIKSEDKKHGGFYIFLTPFYMPVDSTLIKRILTKDFDCFMNHGLYFDKERDPLTGHLFNLEGQKWRNLRAKLTPLFTSGKMKYMYQTFLACTEGLKELLYQKLYENEAVDIKDVLARYTIDIIGNCAFGVNCNSLADPNCEFRKYGQKIFEIDWITTLARCATNVLPKGICKLLGVKVIKPDVSRFFMGIVRETVDYREKHNLSRVDFMHLLLQLKNGGKVTDEETMLTKEPSQKSVLSLDELAAQCFFFFLAGYETSATTMTFTLFELAKNPIIQNKLREEIRTIWELYDDSYEAIMKMSYLEKVICEALRKYPPVPGTARVCNTTYKIPGTDTILEPGTRVHIPIIGVHMDPEYYPDPEKFDPERFTEDAKASRPGCTWMPFGDGPRTCIGLRFALLQSKLGIATIINNFRISLSDKTQLPLKMDSDTLVYSTKGKIWLNMEKV